LYAINVALKRVVLQRAVSDAKMNKALTAEQYAEYVRSFDWDMSHVESDERDEMPLPVDDYIDKVREGDKYTRIANLFRRSKKRDMQGRTAFDRYDLLGFSEPFIHVRRPGCDPLAFSKPLETLVPAVHGATRQAPTP